MTVGDSTSVVKVHILNPSSAAVVSGLVIGGLGAITWTAFHQLGDHFLFFSAITLLVLSGGSLLLLAMGIVILKQSSRFQAFVPPKFQEDCGCVFEWDSATIIPQSKLLEFRQPDWSIPRLERLADGSLVARHRGVFRQFGLQVVVTDLLGLVSVRLSICGPAEIVVLPADVSAPGGILVDQQSGGDTEDAQSGTPEGDLLDTHQHQRGQSFRHFMWKAYHRSGGRIMLVRKPEKTATSTKVFFFLPSEDDETGASLVRLLIEDKIAGGNWWLFVPGSGRLFGPRDRDEAMHSLAESGNWQGDLSVEIRKFEEMARDNFAGAKGVVIMTNQPQGDSERWADNLRLAVHELAGFNPSIIVAINKGQHFSPQNFDGEYGLARPVEIEMPSNLLPQSEL